MRNLLMLSIAIICGLVLIAGCAGTKPETPLSNKTQPKTDSNPSNLQEGLKEGEVKVLDQQPKERPDWIDSLVEWKKKNPDVLYFMGIAIPNEYEAKAFESAHDNAAAEIAAYLFNCVDVKKFFSDKERNSEGYVPIQSLARDTVRKYIVASILANQYGIARFTQYCAKKEYGALIHYYQIYRLFEYPRAEAKSSIAKAREEIQQKIQEERDEAKRKLLEQSDKMLNEMEQEVTKPAGKK